MSDGELKSVQQQPSWARAARPMVWDIGKWERRVWMVCFWASFITATIQVLIVGFLLFISSWRAFNPTRGHWLIELLAPAWQQPMWWWFVRERIGVILDFSLSIVAAPLAMYGFARARKGIWRRVPLYSWLVSRIACAAILLACEVELRLQGEPTSVLAPTFAFRVLLFDAPIWLWILGVVVIRWERSRLGAAGLRGPNAPQAEVRQIDPLA
jgi:hypothetical protein